MESNLFTKLSKTKSIEMSDEVVRAIPRTLSETELASVAGGAKTQRINFAVGDTITISNSVSGGVQDDCQD